MAIKQLKFVKSSGRTAEGIYDYISREGEHTSHADRCLLTGAANLPNFANGSARNFWKTADSNERSNAKKCTHIVMCLPLEFNADQNRQLVEDFVSHNFNGCPVSWAIHEGHKENPHAHIMLCERRWANEREKGFSASRYFKRNGVKKDRSLNHRSYCSSLYRKYAGATNYHLERAEEKARLEVEPQGHEHQEMSYREKVEVGIERKIRAEELRYQDLVSEIQKEGRENGLDGDQRSRSESDVPEHVRNRNSGAESGDQEIERAEREAVGETDRVAEEILRPRPDCGETDELPAGGEDADCPGDEESRERADQDCLRALEQDIAKYRQRDEQSQRARGKEQREHAQECDRSTGEHWRKRREVLQKRREQYADSERRSGAYLQECREHYNRNEERTRQSTEGEFTEAYRGDRERLEQLRQRSRDAFRESGEKRDRVVCDLGERLERVSARAGRTGRFTQQSYRDFKFITGAVVSWGKRVGEENRRRRALRRLTGRIKSLYSRTVQQYRRVADFIRRVRQKNRIIRSVIEGLTPEGLKKDPIRIPPKRVKIKASESAERKKTVIQLKRDVDYEPSISLPLHINIEDAEVSRTERKAVCPGLSLSPREPTEKVEIPEPEEIELPELEKYESQMTRWNNHNPFIERLERRRDMGQGISR